MKVLAWVLRLAVVLVLVWFAVRNSQVVTLNGLPGQAWPIPLVLALLVAFVAGVAFGVLAWLPTVFRQRRELGKLRRATVATRTASAPVSVEADHSGASHGV